MSDRVSLVRLPILKSFTISNYQLYPGQEGEGFSALVHKGVNVVMGINGLGKTTLLNALFRVLSGPTDWSSRSFDKPARSTDSELGKWKTREYFTRRVPDRAKHATISATIGFGDDEIQITRRLSDLAPTSLRVRGVSRPAVESTYQEAVCQLGRLQAFSDFYLILRYLVFFLEDRQPVLWDKTAQADIVRVLFYDAEASTNLRKWFAEIQRLDSQYRNKRVPYNLAVTELKELQTARAAEGPVREQLELLQTRMEACAGREQDLLTEEDRLRDELIRRQRLLQQQEHHLEEEIREHERLEQRYLGDLFPRLGSVVEYVFGHLRSGGGCLVCGNRSAELTTRLLHVKENGACPVCDSPPEQQENVVPAKEVSDRRLGSVYDSIQEIRRSIAGVKEDIAALQAALSTTRTALLEVQEEQSQLRKERTGLHATLPQDDRQILGLEDFVSRRGAELRELEKERQKLDDLFREVQEQQRAKVEILASRITSRFERFAGSFLADDCTLEYSRHERRIGQESEFQIFPLFTVKLSSGVFQNEVQPRDDPHEVSESQKEFIDLAFRMALIDIASEGLPSMMVLETPEASLDAVFIMRAGLLLAEFASGGGTIGNRLIASTNLNQTRMIPALFGITDPEDRASITVPQLVPVPMEERKDRIVDLLVLAQRSEALEDNWKLYRLRADQAIYPERYPRVAETRA